MVTIVGVVSDTHIPRRAKTLPLQLLRGLEGVDLILHGGDIIHESVLQELSLIAPVTAVYGNVDPPTLQQKLARTRIIDLGYHKLGLIHGDGSKGTTVQRAKASFTNVDCVIFGHSHQPLNCWQDGVLLFNPGSPTDRRRCSHFSYGVLTVGERLTGEIIYF